MSFLIFCDVNRTRKKLKKQKNQKNEKAKKSKKQEKTKCQDFFEKSKKVL